MALSGISVEDMHHGHGHCQNEFVEAKHGDACCNIIWEVRQKNHKPETQ